MNDDAAAYLAVGIPWDHGWEVIVLDPTGEVIAVSSARGANDVEWVARDVLRDCVPRWRQPIRLRVHCRPDRRTR